MILVSPAQDVENVEMDLGSDNIEGEGEVVESDQSKEEKPSVRNIFGSIVDFITNKNHLDDDSNDNDEEYKVNVNQLIEPKELQFDTKTEPGTRKHVHSVFEGIKHSKTEIYNHEEDDFKSRIMGFFTSNTSRSKQNSPDINTPKVHDSDNNLQDLSNLTKDEKLYRIDERSRQECLAMLTYYRPSGNNKNAKKLEKYIPKFIELDCPIPEELSLDYDYAKYDISSLLPKPESMTEDYHDILIKYETLSCFCHKKQTAYRKMNDRFVEKVEINLFPLILDSAVLNSHDSPERTQFMISINGTKSREFWRYELTDYFSIYKKNLMLGYLYGDKYKFMNPFEFDDT